MAGRDLKHVRLFVLRVVHELYRASKRKREAGEYIGFIARDNDDVIDAADA